MSKDFENFADSKDYELTNLAQEFLTKLAGVDIPLDMGIIGTILDKSVEVLEDCGYPACYPYRVYDEQDCESDSIPCCEYGDCRTRKMYPEICFKK